MCFRPAAEEQGRVFELLDRKPRIDANHSVGLKLNQVEGKLRIRDGEFSYPTRKDIQVKVGTYPIRGGRSET